MSQQPRELESYFQEIGATSSVRGDDEASMEDFNTFFERLSSIDDLTWSDGAPSEHVDPSGDDVEPSGEEPDPRIAVRTPRRRSNPRRTQPMHVLHSDQVPVERTAQRATAGRTHTDPLMDEAVQEEPSPEAFAPGRGPRWATMLKIGMAGTAFFALGLLGGWLALSLPQQEQPAPVNLDRRMATVDQRGQSRSGSLQPPPTPPEKKMTANADATRSDVPRTPDSTAAVEPARTVAAEPSDRAGQSATPPAAPSAEAVDKATATPKGDYALQVGACSSYRCVERYRKLLLTHVTSDTIRIHKQTTDAGTIQRVRVGPLTEAQGERLKRDLARADERFQQAYLVGLR